MGWCPILIVRNCQIMVSYQTLQESQNAAERALHECQGVIMFSVKDPLKFVFLLINSDLSKFSLCQNLREVLSQFYLFLLLSKFEFSPILSYWVLSQFESFSFFSHFEFLVFIFLFFFKFVFKYFLCINHNFSFQVLSQF